MIATSKRRGTMKKLCLGIAVLLALGMMASVVLADDDTRGNGLPKAVAAYKLVIHGVSNPDHMVGDSGNARTLFIPREGKAKIYMQQDGSGDFRIIDRNGLDKDGARFNIGDKDPGPGLTTYKVYLRLVGKPNTSITIDPELIVADADGKQYVFLQDVTTFVRENGAPKAEDISGMFRVDIYDLAGNLLDKNVWVFSLLGVDYWWEVTNDGVRTAQVWFFEEGSTSPAPAKGTPTTTWATIKSR
jgi:hypothetical protein